MNPMSYDRRIATEINWSIVRQVALKVIRQMGKPLGRARTIAMILKAVGSNDILMQAFAQLSSERPLRSENVEELLGEAILVWKDAWEVSEDEEYDGLSADPALTRGLNDIAKRWTVQGDVPLPRNYTEAYSLATRWDGLLPLLQKLAHDNSRDEEADRKNALRHLEAIKNILK